jgi:zinc transport system substrate-binding protein
MFSIITYANAEIKVVTSIKPIHSITSYIMDGVGSPDLIVDGYNSPHNFQLKPSHAKMLQNADLVIFVGEGIEEFLEKPLESIAKDAKKFALLEQSGFKKLKFREKNIFEEHDDHDDHDKKAKKKDDHDDHGHDDHGHGHGEYDPHIWLDPINAKAMIKKITKLLSKMDKENSSTYKSNSKKAIKEIDMIVKEIKSEMNKDLKFVVFHDAYQYFENRFDISVLGALTVNTDVLPGAEQLSEIREVIEHENVNCIFSEPQFNPDIINAIAMDTNVKTGVLDPLGATLEPGKDLYFDLIRNISKSFKGC